jgi:hypothetical protein
MAARNPGRDLDSRVMRELVSLASWLSVVVVGVLVAVPTLVFVRAWNGSSMDVGPFQASLCHELPIQPPRQRFKIWSGMTLLSFDRPEDEEFAIVALENAAGDILWAVSADTTTGDDPTNVDWIEFESYMTFPWPTPRARARTYWSSGHESTWWFITRDGQLVEYLFSW